MTSAATMVEKKMMEFQSNGNRNIVAISAMVKVLVVVLELLDVV